MKLLLVLGADKTFNSISSLKNSGYDLIRYRHVQKAMDNIDEIDPHGIIISANDFPRHWKPLVSFVRSSRPVSKCPIVVLIGENFPDEERDKASALEVNGLVPESPEKTETIEEIRHLLQAAAGGSAPAVKAKSNTERSIRFGFVFSNPEDEKLVTGTVTTVTASGFSFEPDYPALTENLQQNANLQNCSFRAEKEILYPACTLVKKGNVLSLEFTFFPKGEKELLIACLEENG
jgi:hypothetical protein